VFTAAPDRSGCVHCGTRQERVCSLRHQTGAQYIAVERTRAKVVVRNVVAPAPQPEPASRFRSATRDVSFLQSDSRCRRYVSDLSYVTPMYLGSEQKGRVSLLRLTMIKCNFEKKLSNGVTENLFSISSLREHLQSFWRFHLFCSNGYCLFLLEPSILLAVSLVLLELEQNLILIQFKSAFGLW